MGQARKVLREVIGAAKIPAEIEGISGMLRERAGVPMPN